MAAGVGVGGLVQDQVVLAGQGVAVTGEPVIEGEGAIIAGDTPEEPGANLAAKLSEGARTALDELKRGLRYLRHEAHDFIFYRVEDDRVELVRREPPLGETERKRRRREPVKAPPRQVAMCRRLDDLAGVRRAVHLGTSTSAETRSTTSPACPSRGNWRPRWSGRAGRE